MKLNYELFKNFKEAALQCNVEVIAGPHCYKIVFESGRYIYCWTPLNKLWSLVDNYYEDKQWDMALDFLKDNFSDFHLEVGNNRDLKDMHFISKFYCDFSSQQVVPSKFSKLSPNTLTVSQIAELINILQDKDAKK
jgi:hypothetical protein